MQSYKDHYQKLVFIILIAITAGIQSSYGQNRVNPVSLNVGGAYSYLPSYEDSRILGYTIGINTEQFITRNLNVVSGVVYNRRGGESGKPFPQNNIKFKYTYNQLTIPLSLKYNLVPRFGIQAGVYGGYNFASHLDYTVNEWNIAGSMLANKPNYKTEDEFSNFEFGSKLGVCFKFSKSWYLEFNVAHSWTPLYKKGGDYQLLLLEQNPNYDIDSELKIDLDKRLLDAKNVFISLELRKILFHY